MDKGDIGSLVGGVIGVGSGVALGLGPIGVGLVAVAGSYAGHHIADSHHHKSLYSKNYYQK